VSWKSKKQQVVARSSVEAEYHVMTSASYELIWLKNLLADLDFVCHTPKILFCDNQAKLIQTSYVHIHDQLANVFTKILPSDQFHHLLSKLGSVNPLDPT